MFTGGRYTHAKTDESVTEKCRDRNQAFSWHNGNRIYHAVLLSIFSVLVQSQAMRKPRSMRWIILCLGIAANLSQGISYSGSVISKPLLERVQIPEAEIQAYWATLFSLGIVFLPLGMIIAGWLTDKRGPRVPIALGAICFASGMFLASIATSYSFLCLTLGFMISMGCGFAYGPIVASAVRWFPDRRGLASGLVVAALGFGPVWIAPFCGMMLSQGFHIATILQCLGVVSLIAIGAAALFITSPPSGFQGAVKPDTPTPDVEQNPVPLATAREMSWTGMIRTFDFWMLFLFFVLGAVPGLMLISQAQKIFVDLGKFELGTAALLVAVLGAANATGRVLWGTISDYLGRINTLAVMFICSAVAMFALPFAANPFLLVFVIFVIGTTFGGYLGLFPSFCADSFGLKNASLNYAILFIAFSVSAIVGPRLYVMLASPQHAFFTAATLALLGAAGKMAYKKRKPSRD
jgi:OFA family oxalate/formate antiporter-like MFS transporter